MNLFEKEEQTAPQRLQKEMEQALMAFMKDDVGLRLFEVPTGQGKTEVATNVIAKMLRDWMEKGTPMRRIFFITPQNKQLPNGHPLCRQRFVHRQHDSRLRE